MRPAETTSPAVRRTWWQEVSTPARAAFACAFPIAFGLAISEAVLGDSLGPEHPLSVTRLALRLGCFGAFGVGFAITAVGTFRAWRRADRLRDGLCPTCGYDLRAAAGRCPECGAPTPVSPADT